MDERLSKYFELTKDNALVIKGTRYAEIRLPDEMFNNKIAELTGDRIISFAFLDIYVWDTAYNENLRLKDATKVLLRLPNIIITHPNRIRHDSKNEEHILEYHEGDKIIVSTKVPKKTNVVIKFFNILLSGKIPSDIPYDEISSYFEECASINGFNMKSNSLFVDLIVAVISRDPNNLSRQFREAIKDNPKISMYDRKLVNMDNIPALTSQFSAISSGNPKFGITTSIGAVRSGDMEPTESDIEEAIK